MRVVLQSSPEDQQTRRSLEDVRWMLAVTMAIGGGMRKQAGESNGVLMFRFPLSFFLVFYPVASR